MTMPTAPMPLEAMSAAPGGLEDFRLWSPPEVHGLLKRLLEGNVLLHLNTPQGAVYTTTLWTIDPARGVIGFAADSGHPQLQPLVDADEVTVVGYLDNIKLQFDLSGLVLVTGASGCVINASMPRELYRFQRRNSFRVRVAGRNTPTAQFAHPMIPDMQLTLRVLDVSIGGCALFLPDDVPALDPGVRINGVQLELDADTRLRTSLLLRHVTSLNADSRGVRLGCEWAGMGGEALRTLQVFIDQTEKRRRMFGTG